MRRGPVLLALALLTLVPNASRAQSAPTGQQFTPFIWEAPKDIAHRTDPVAGQAYWDSYAKLGTALQEAGVLRGGSALKTGAEVRTVRGSAERTGITSGGVRAGSAELGGYFIIEVASREAAEQWAARIPAAKLGRVEVRGAYPVPGMMKP
jgi:hypothetical protein